MALYKRGETWWYEFVYAGERVRESAKTSRKTVAAEAEKRRRLELERAHAGMVESEPSGISRVRTIAAAISEYSKGYEADHTPKACRWSSDRLAHVQRLVGGVRLCDLSQSVVRDYMKRRKAEDASGRTINMELGELSRVVGRPWSFLWPDVNKLPENEDIGRALSPEEETALLRAVEEPLKGSMSGTLIRLALMTGMRSDELKSMRWSQVDVFGGLLTVGKAKTAAGTGRVIPMNSEVRALLATHREWFVEHFGEPQQEHYVFPWGSPRPKDPTRSTTTLKTAWTTIRKAAGVQCRWHDLRHTAATKLAEAGTPEETMKALLGHMSRRMLERYSHIRMKAKREAVEALTLNRVPTKVPTVRGSKSVH